MWSVSEKGRLLYYLGRSVESFFRHNAMLTRYNH